MAVLDELASEARKIVAEGGALSVRLLAERVFLSPSTVQARIGSMQSLEVDIARAICNDMLLQFGEEQPLVDEARRNEARQQTAMIDVTDAEFVFAWDCVVQYDALVDIRDRAFAFMWPEIDPAHYPHWADHLTSVIKPIVLAARDPSSQAPQLHGPIRVAYAEWLEQQQTS